MASWRDLAIADIQRGESLRLEAYLDPEGVWTIAYGHTRDVKPGDRCTETQALNWLYSDCGIAEHELDQHVPWWKGCPDAVRRGLLNMSFNLGWPRLSKFSKMLACGAAGDWTGMADNALDSVWAKQVKSRAEFIAELFRSANQLELAV